jgi:nucleoside-diphosphate-sugar epimerase
MMATGKKTVLVTGGAGRLGRALVTELVRQGEEVRVLVQTREDALRLAPGATPYVGDIADEEALRKACKGVDAVIHLAAIVSQYRTGSHEILRTNVLGTRKVAAAAKAAGAKKIIFASTVNVYGRVRKERLDEKKEPRPTDTYGQSKRLAEREIMDSGLNYTILRMATIYGWQGPHNRQRQ